MKNGTTSDWDLATSRQLARILSINHRRNYLVKCVDKIKSERRNALLEKTMIRRDEFWPDVLKRESDSIRRAGVIRDKALWGWISKMRGFYKRKDGSRVVAGEARIRWKKTDSKWRVCITKCAASLSSRRVLKENVGGWVGFLRAKQALLKKSNQTREKIWKEKSLAYKN